MRGVRVRLSGGAGASTRRGGIRGDFLEWQAHGEQRASVVPVAVRFDYPAVHFHDAPDDGEAEPDAAVHTRGRGVRLAERLEEVWEELPGDADARIAYAHHDMSRVV